MTEEEKRQQEIQQQAQPRVGEAAETQNAGAAQSAGAVQTTGAAASGAAPIYGGSYDSQIRDLYSRITDRTPYTYSLDGDAVYQALKDRYTANARAGMRDTMGQAANLTGGYGSSYAQQAGQQQYDITMRGLTDYVPQLEQQAYSRWRDRGSDLQNQYAMLGQLGAQEQATRNQTYSQIASLISSSGYQPTEEDLANSGMTAEQANALLQMWIASNPLLAWQQGKIDPDSYYQLTGQYPPGYSAGGGGYSGGGYGGGSSSGGNEKDPVPGKPGGKGTLGAAGQTAWTDAARSAATSAAISGWTPGDVSAYLQQEYGLDKRDADGVAQTAYEYANQMRAR